MESVPDDWCLSGFRRIERIADEYLLSVSLLRLMCGIPKLPVDSTNGKRVILARLIAIRELDCSRSGAQVA